MGHLRQPSASGRPRKWVWPVFPSLDLTVGVTPRLCGVRRCRRGASLTYAVAGVGDGTVEALLGHRLSARLETRRQDY